MCEAGKHREWDTSLFKEIRQGSPSSNMFWREKKRNQRTQRKPTQEPFKLFSTLMCAGAVASLQRTPTDLRKSLRVLDQSWLPDWEQWTVSAVHHIGFELKS